MIYGEDDAFRLAGNDDGSALRIYSKSTRLESRDHQVRQACWPAPTNGPNNAANHRSEGKSREDLGDDLEDEWKCSAAALDVFANVSPARLRDHPPLP
jgi:hypothetical protein